MDHNKFYIDKINKIRDSFTPNEVDHIEILESLIEKPKSKFILPKISISQTAWSRLMQAYDE